MAGNANSLDSNGGVVLFRAVHTLCAADRIGFNVFASLRTAGAVRFAIKKQNKNGRCATARKRLARRSNGRPCRMQSASLMPLAGERNGSPCFSLAVCTLQWSFCAF